MVALPPTTSIARVFFTLVGLAIAVYVVYLVRDVVALLVVSVFTALALGPAVNFFDRRLPRPGAILVVYLFILLGIVGVGLLVVPPIASEVKGLSRDVPGYFKDLPAQRPVSQVRQPLRHHQEARGRGREAAVAAG